MKIKIFLSSFAIYGFTVVNAQVGEINESTKIIGSDGEATLYLERVSGRASIKGTTGSVNGAVVIDAATDADKLFLNHYTSSNTFIGTGGGNVSIGSTNVPSARLQVFSAATLGAKFNPDNAAIQVTNGTRSLLIDDNEIYSDDALAFGTPDNRDFIFRNVYSDSEKVDLVRITPAGHIGVNTSSPDHGSLQINGNGPENGVTIWTQQGELTSRFWANADDRLLHITKGGNPENGITINEGGNVGIGTVDPQSKLAVEGEIRATSVKVLADIGETPDYVFEADYDLRPLSEVEDYINENKHLPEVPSAAEVEANGLDLGDMNLLLLKKVEEMTLYQIEMMKLLNAQKAEIEQIKKENAALKAIVTAE